MLSVSCDVAYLLCTTTLWSGLCFLQWESLDPPPHLPHPPFLLPFSPWLSIDSDLELTHRLCDLGQVT